MNTNFLNIRFPDDIAFGAIGGPVFNTTIIRNNANIENRFTTALKPMIHYNVGHNIKTEKQMSELLAFFRICHGKANAFRFRDWLDYSAKKQFIGNIDLPVDDQGLYYLQLNKVYNFCGINYNRIITKPIASTVVLEICNQEGFYETVDKEMFEVNELTGIVSVKALLPLKSRIFASFEFDIKARFDTDAVKCQINEGNTYTWNDIPIVEIV